MGSPSWQAQVSGTKLWRLVPPPECYFECAEKLEVTVSPGEISKSVVFVILLISSFSTTLFLVYYIELSALKFKVNSL